MALTEVTITGRLYRAPGVPAGPGKALFRLTEPLFDPGVKITTRDVIAAQVLADGTVVADDGITALQLWSNSDPEVLPAGTGWAVTILTGGPVIEFEFALPAVAEFDISEATPRPPTAPLYPYATEAALEAHELLPGHTAVTTIEQLARPIPQLGSLLVPLAVAAYVTDTLPVTGAIPLVGAGQVIEGPATLVFRAVDPDTGQNRMFKVRNATRATLRQMTLQAAPPVAPAVSTGLAVSLTGTIRGVRIERVEFVDVLNFALAYGKSGEVDPNVDYIDGLYLIGLRGRGVSSPDEGTGSAVNLFPRVVTLDPITGQYIALSKNVLVHDFVWDLTNGSPDVTLHGPQGIKLNAIRQVIIDEAIIYGGSISAITVTNGASDVLISNVFAYGSAIGLIISGNVHDTEPGLAFTQRVRVRNFVYRAAGAVNAPGAAIEMGNVVDVECVGLDLHDGGIRYAIDNSRPCGDHVWEGTINRESFIINNPGGAQADIFNVRCDLLIIGVANKSSTGRFTCDAANWKPAGWRCNLVLRRNQADAVRFNGSDSDMWIRTEDSNSNNAANVAAVWDKGTKNRWHVIDSQPGNRQNDWHYKRDSDGEWTLEALVGVARTAPLNLTGCTRLPVGAGEAHASIDLAAASDTTLLSGIDAVILAVEWKVEAATGAVLVNRQLLNRNGTVTYIATTTLASAAVDTAEKWINTAGDATSFANRIVAAGDRLRLVCPGGGVGRIHCRVIYANYTP